MLDSVRQNAIISYLSVNHSATVKELAAALYVSDATVRRDLTRLQSLGLLKRSHGGAILLEHSDDISIFVRMTENAKEKELAATNTLKHLPADYKTVFFDSSSTVLALAQRMDLSNKTVMTNNLQTALQLSKIKGINLLIPGGSITTTSVSITGGWTNELLSGFHFDLMLTSCGALDAEYAYENSIEQRSVKRTVFDRSDCRILIVDHKKFPKKGTYVFRELKAFDKIVFDRLSGEEKSLLDGLPVLTE